MLFAPYYNQGHGYYGRSAWDELHPDPNDFTEADGAALRKPEEDRPFEEDMQGS